MPYVGCDLPGDMRIFVNRTEGVFGVVFVVSLYCRARENIEGYLRILDGVLLSSSSEPVTICMDAIAASPLWFSKISAQARGYESFSRASSRMVVHK